MSEQVEIKDGDRFVATRNFRHELFCADALLDIDYREVIDGRKIAAILTDPPYSSGGATTASRRKPSTSKYQQSSSDASRFPEIHGDLMDQRSWTRWAAGWLGELWKSSSAETYLLSFIDWRQVAALMDAVQVAGWWHRGLLAWFKTNARAPHLGMFRQPEFVLWATGGRLRAKREHGKMIPGVYSSSYVRNRRHLTQKPVEVLEWLLSILPTNEGLVVDPFCGSASTAVAADQTGRDSLLFEKSPPIMASALERLEEDGFQVSRV